MQRPYEPEERPVPDRGSVADVDHLDLTCPSCGTDLVRDEQFATWRVCGECGRHFAIGARERILLLVDAGVFQELDSPPDEIASAQGLLPAAERLAEHQHLQVIGDAVVTGYGSIGGAYAVIVALDDHLVGHSLGAMLSNKVIRAFDYALSEKLPVVLLVAGGTLAVPAGPLSIAQGSRLATGAAQLHLEGIPVIGILTQPMSTGIFGTVAAHCDLLFSEPNVDLHEGGPGLEARHGDVEADSLLAGGWIDGIVARPRLSAEIGRFLDIVTSVGMARPDGHAWLAPPNPAEGQQGGVAWYLAALVPGGIQIRGDRVRGENRGVICGIGRLDTVSVAYVGIDSPDGPVEPESAAVAARKILRLARLAGRLELPVVIVVNGRPGTTAVPFSVEAAFANSSLSSALSVLPVPVVSVGLGRISGSLATLLMNADRQFLASGAAVTPPPDPASGWQPGRLAGAPAGQGAIGAADCLRLGLIDGVIPDARDSGPLQIVTAIRSTVVQSLAELAGTGQRRLLDTRVLRQRTLGQSTPDGLAEARSELWALQEWQRGVERNVERSLDEWRGRWENLKANQPRLNFQRPDIGDLAARVRARRTELLGRAGLGDRSTTD